MGIKKDLQAGSSGENTVRTILENADFEVQKNLGDVEDIGAWDLICSSFTRTELYGKVIKIEVKNDMYAEKSGNIAIEHWNSRQDKPAGINRTTADLWMHIIPNSGVWMTSVKLLKYYFATNAPFRVIKSGGDGNADMYLYKMDKILPAIFVDCSVLSKKELQDKIMELQNE